MNFKRLKFSFCSVIMLAIISCGQEDTDVAEKIQSKTSLSAKAATGNIINMAFTSDPQYPWYDNVFPTGLTTDAQKQANSERLIRDQYKDINNLNTEKSLSGVIINGDLTAFGHDWQFAKYQELVNTLNVKFYPGLGNHDYENNVNDSYNNNAATRMVNYMNEWEVANGVNRDFELKTFYKFPQWVNEYNGSLSYSFDIGNIHFIQLQNHPLYENSWDSYLGGIWRAYYHIYNSLTWLENDLKNARNMGKHVIINMHQPKDDSRLNTLIDKYSVSAVFAGHLHSTKGTYKLLGSSQIPLYLSGGASYQTYLRTEFDMTNKIGKVFVRYKLDGDSSYRERSEGTFNLK